jgi:glycerate kinase
VITGEGHLDPQSFAGKVVGGVAALAALAGVRCVAIVGGADADLPRHEEFPSGFGYVSLVERFGDDQAMWATAACIEEAAIEVFAEFDRLGA